MMKSFNRSVVGKTINFIIINICAVAFVATLMGIFIAAEFDIYAHSEEDVINTIVGRDIKNDLISIVIENLVNKDENIEFYGYAYKLINNKNELAAKSKENVVRKDYILYYDVRIEGDDVIDIAEMDDALAVPSGKRYTLIVDVNDYVGNQEGLLTVKDLMDAVYFFKDWFFVILFSSFIIGLFSFIFLMMAAGRKGKTDEAVPGLMNGVPLDLLIVIIFALDVLLLAAWGEMTDAFADRINMFSLVSLFFVFEVWFNTTLGLAMTCASRIKQHVLIKNTICYKVLHFFWTLNKNIVLSLPHIWLVVVFIAFVFCLQIIVMLISFISEDGFGFVLFTLFLDVVLSTLVLYIASMLTRLQKMGKNIAQGNIGNKVSTAGLFGSFKRHAENLNSISEGMSLAVEKEIKSDRMKTELITNVSHDLKTPLTSIINYADLIAKEPCDNENIIEYSGILVKQSDRLKRLIEDLVEASKASTGNLEVNFEPCNPGVFLSQAGGEYEEKLSAKNLQLVTKQPEEEICIMADPRRMWRIFDNLMNNISKYSLEGSRVYLSLEVIGKRAVMTFKNTSREALDISEEELMERFVRGDSSRNTEGNGLGLSIAKSLAELQNGTLSVSIDGDLFKAVLSFPLSEKTEGNTV